AQIIVQPSASTSADELRRHASGMLPRYMVPDRVSFVETLPRTNNGKLDRNMLGQQEEPTETVATQTGDEPRNRVEDQLAKWWREVLDVPSVGRNDDFFELGGHSLDAVTVFARIREEFATDLPLATLFEAPTIAALAEILSEGNTLETAHEDAAATAADTQPVIDRGQAKTAAEPMADADDRRDQPAAVALPQNELELRLAEWWREALEIDEIGRDDDFFELGGHSLDAVTVFTRIRNELAVDMPLATLFEAPTIAALASAIGEDVRVESEPRSFPRRGEKNPFTHLVPLATDRGAKSPLYLVGGKFGNVLNLIPLAKAIDDARDVYGLQARGLKGDETPHTSIREMAADCLAEVRQCQPHGPYVFGGYCLGGIVGLEMARQAAEAGDTVSNVIVIDGRLHALANLGVADRFMLQCQLFRRHGLTYPWTWLRNRARWERQRVAGALGATTTGDRSQVVGVSLMNALADYEPPPYGGRVTLLRGKPEVLATVTGGRTIDFLRWDILKDNGLSSCCADLRIHAVDAIHTDLLVHPHVKEVAAIVNEALAATEDWPRR
ncbi:MAG: alpha/beta fold hydrolase, partial [Pirellulales bacterium]|nr:alpha/beta fold hydrolase [Pirellulales bacterium]